MLGKQDGRAASLAVGEYSKNATNSLHSHHQFVYCHTESHMRAYVDLGEKGRRQATYDSAVLLPLHVEPLSQL